MPSHGDRLLKGRYALSRLVSRRGHSELWLALDQDGGQTLLKAWPYQGEKPNDVVRALWDRELRNLFRLSSSPEAESRLLVLRDAGVDAENRCFVMLLAAPGYETLRQVLDDRSRYEWLRDLRTPEARLPLWRAMRDLALGLTQLHDQQMLHRSLSSDSVFLDAAVGPESMRLGGFEWTVRVGQPTVAPATADAPSAPELTTTPTLAQTFESDWYQFGVLLAQVFSGVGQDVVTTPARQGEIVARVRDAQKITGVERDLLVALLDRSPDRRLGRGAEVVAEIDNIIIILDQPARVAENVYLALTVLLGPNRLLTEAICEIEPTVQPLDTETQRLFIQGDLESPRIVALANSDRKAFILQGNRLVYLIKEYSEPDQQPPGQWNLAFCDRTYELRYATGDSDQIQLTRLPVRVFRLQDAKRDPSVVQRNAFSWRTLLPKIERFAKMRETQERLHEFFRVTNQLELLFRDAEVFPYRIVHFQERDGVQEVVITTKPGGRRVADFAAVRDGLSGFLQLQRAEKRDGSLVYLGPEDCVRMDRQVPRPEFWEISEIDEQRGEVRLKRVGASFSKPTAEGFLRCFDMFGQISLIRRRQRAIERLRNHSYLLKALRTPGLVYIDTGESVLPVPIDENKVDEAKRHALRNIWRTRPIFALQGPPGTGKTTLVAHLLGQIFADDSVAQVLVTAQAHSAVDVLRDKVSRDIFRGQSDVGDQPLAVRLTRAGELGEGEPDSLRNVTLRVLDAAEQRVTPDSDLTREWIDEVKKAKLALQRDEPSPAASDMRELVKRSASIVYSTTTAGDLEELADLTQSFDWSLIEESGKAHGFDLALPLQTGHRWLLIGDQNQLPPYRFPDFLKGLQALDNVMDALMSLPDHAGGLVDIDLILRWRALTDPEKEERQTLWATWLPFFAHLHRNCSEAVRDEGDSQSTGLLASMLWQQHRMHPTIAGLISAAYYDRVIDSMTVDRAGKPLLRVVHPFIHPSPIDRAQILWIDTGWRGAGQFGAEDETGIDDRETSSVEAETIKRCVRALQPRPAQNLQLRLAVLSPYRRQVIKLSSTLREIYAAPPSWLAPLGEDEPPASTVDSFQGNQADVVIVSLVRQNRRPPGEGLGFLKEASRMNVLFSRAESLLVLVGSWDFFQFQLRNASRDRNQPLGHWKLALEYIEQQIGRGNALLLNGRTFKEDRL